MTFTWEHFRVARKAQQEEFEKTNSYPRAFDRFHSFFHLPTEEDYQNFLKQFGEYVKANE
jgi:hypothetical protein